MKKLYLLCTLLIGCANSTTTDFSEIPDSGVADADSGTCNLSKCPIPSSGLLVCCTSNNLCGYKSGDAGICYQLKDAGSGGTGGSNP